MSFSILEKIKNVTNVEEIYREFNATDIEFAEDTLISLFENSVKKFPDNIAVKNGEDCITYKILNTKADAVAAYLYAHKIEANDKVGVIAARSIETIINIIAMTLSKTFFNISIPPFFIYTNRKDMRRLLCLRRYRAPPPLSRWLC